MGGLLQKSRRDCRSHRWSQLRILSSADFFSKRAQFSGFCFTETLFVDFFPVDVFRGEENGGRTPASFASFRPQAAWCRRPAAFRAFSEIFSNGTAHAEVAAEGRPDLNRHSKKKSTCVRLCLCVCSIFRLWNAWQSFDKKK